MIASGGTGPGFRTWHKAPAMAAGAFCCAGASEGMGRAA